MRAWCWWCWLWVWRPAGFRRRGLRAWIPWKLCASSSFEYTALVLAARTFVVSQLGGSSTIGTGSYVPRQMVILATYFFKTRFSQHILIHLILFTIPLTVGVVTAARVFFATFEV